MAKFAGYQGEVPLGVMDKLIALRNAQGQERFQITLQGYVEGIKFLSNHPQTFSGQDVMSALQTGTVQSGPALVALGDLLGTMQFPTPGVPEKTRVEVFVEKLFGVK